MLSTLKQIAIKAAENGGTITEISSGVKPFMFMKPLADAINNSQLQGISQPISTLLFVIDIFIIFGIVATIGCAVWGTVRIAFKKMSARDETVNVKELEANIKKEKKNLIIATLVLGIVFLLLPAIVSIAGAIVSSTNG